MVDKTIQVNFRFPKDLIEDLDFVSRLKKVQRSEWVKLKLAEILAKEKEELIDHITRRYLKGYIDEREYKEKLGYAPNKELQNSRTIDMITPEKQEKYDNATKTYFKDAVKKTKN